jgi:hypothetical protein
MTTSWDCFDTIIGRNFYTPVSIFQIISNKINDPTFIDKRIKAERLSRYKTYQDIYKYLPEYDPSIELDIEKKYSFPILENFNRVQDGDIIISDMYFSPEEIKDLLNYHNFNKDVKILSTYGGKHSGRVWDWLKSSKIKIKYHFGDNIHSDVKMARHHGFQSIFFGGHSFTEEEGFLEINGQAHLASLMRKCRLSNPYHMPRSLFYHSLGSFQHIAGHNWIEEINGQIYPYTMHKNFEDHFLLMSKKHRNILIQLYFNGDSFIARDGKTFIPLYKGVWEDYPINYQSTIQKLIWGDQSQYNIPLLILIALNLPSNKELIFSQRDCLYLQQVYNKLLNKNSLMLEVSRAGYLKPFNNEYIQYVLSNVKNKLIIDSHGSGYSANSFFSNQNQDFDLHHVFKHYLDIKKKQRLGSPPDIEIGSNMECLSLGGRTWFCPGRSFEKFNIHNTGRLIDWKNNQAIRSEPEHDPIIANTISKCIDYLCRSIDPYIEHLSPKGEVLSLLSMKLKTTFTDIVVESIGK